MRKFCLTLVAAIAIVGALIGARASAAVIGADALRMGVDEFDGVQTVQFVWKGQRYCWYNRGWRGAGWYRCGFQWRRGAGWGGPSGWRGWRRPGMQRPPGKRPGVNRPGNQRPGVNRPGGQRPGGGRPTSHGESGPS